MDFLDDLNPEQHAAATADDGPVMIIAGPGTGKTKTLAARIAYLLASKRAAPSQVLALTFTNKAAGEMRQRVAALLGAGIAVPHIATFHALGHDVLASQQQGRLQFIDDAERNMLLKSLPRPAALKGMSLREVSLLVSRHKNNVTQNAELAIAEFATAYNNALAARHLHDFDDLLSKTLYILQQQFEVCAKLQNRYRYILVDEFQDTSDLQYDILQIIRNHNNLFVIGDPLQSIYGFRGANGNMFDRFAADFTDHVAVTLATNYRSTTSVVRLANAVFANAPQLIPHSSQAGRVEAVQVLNEFSEAAYIIEQIEQGVGGSNLQRVATAHEGGRTFKDFAVLYRTHQAAKVLQSQLAQHGIPYQVAGEGSPYEQSALQALIAILRAIQTNNYDQLAKQSALSDFNENQIKVLLEKLPQVDQPSVLARAAIDTFGLGGDKPQIQQLLNQFCGTLVRFDAKLEGLAESLAYVDNLSETAFYDAQAEAVTLLTIHASKGLEFNHIFLLAAEEGILPKIRKNSSTDLDEEQRLFYVAVTRAREALEVLYTKKRAGQEAVLSRFAKSISPTILPRIIDPSLAIQQKRIQKRQQKAAQITLF